MNSTINTNDRISFKKNLNKWHQFNSPSLSPTLLSLSPLPTHTGLTPLHVAVLGGHQECVKLLVNSQVDVNMQDSKSGKTALHCAVEKGDLTLTGYLLTQVGGSHGDYT